MASSNECSTSRAILVLNNTLEVLKNMRNRVPIPVSELEYSLQAALTELRAVETPPWYESIPEGGVLCWISDSDEHPDESNAIELIRNYIPNNEYPFKAKTVGWRYATPLTQGEISRLYHNAPDSQHPPASEE